MDYRVQIGEDEFVFSISGSRDSIRVSQNGESVPVDLREVGPGAYSLIVGEKAHFVTAEKDRRGLTVRMNGRSYPARVERAGAADPASRPRGEEKEVRSLMPGIVTRLLVQPGVLVEPGAALLVLEAMKMENEVRSHREGVVETIHVKEGQSVDAGDLLVTLRPA